MKTKLLASVVALGVVVSGIVAYACSDGEEYRTYEYRYVGNGEHEVAYSCSYPMCDDPFTVVGDEPCTYEWEYVDESHDIEHEICIYCGHVRAWR